MKRADVQLIYQTPTSALYYDDILRASYVIWDGFASSADFRATCTRSLDLTRERGIHKSISDARNMRVIPLADQQWFTEELLPQLVTLSSKPTYYSAVIMPLDFFGRQSLDNITEQAEEVMTQQFGDFESVTRYFSSEKEARAWLQQVDTDPAARSPDQPVYHQKGT